MSSTNFWHERNLQRLPDFDDSRLPALVLGLEPPDADVRIEFAPGRNWFYLEHQTAGICCHHQWLYATPLNFRAEVVPAAKALASTWLGSHAGCQGSNLDNVIRYRAQLQEEFGVDCKCSFTRFQEAYYPIDPTPDAIRRLTSDLLPDDLEELLISASTAQGRVYEPLHDPSEFAGGWQLVILGENSD